MNGRLRRLISLVGVWAGQLPAVANAAPAGGLAIDVYYFERPPYMTRHAGSDEVSGLTASPAAAAFRAAGIAIRWVQMPTMRQLVTLKETSQAACAVGWFRNAEREQQFKFSRAIYRDKPTVGLARTDYVQHSLTLAETLHQPGLVVLVKDGFSYGPVIDNLLSQVKPERVVTSAESVAMARMIVAQRAQFMFAAEEEAAYLTEQAGLPSGTLKVLPFTDVPPGERRYILCSRAMPDEAMERLNKAITVDLP